MKDHDSFYVQYLQSMFGNASIAFFGVLIAIVSLILMCVIVMLNSSTVFMTPVILQGTNDTKLPITKPTVI